MKFLKRSSYCGEVSESHIQQTVILNGWVHRYRDHGGVIFIDLRDRTGIVQVVFDPAHNAEAAQQAHALRSEYVVALSGIVTSRAPEMVNHKLATGKIEIQGSTLQILSTSKPPHFQLDEQANVSEELRLKYRYLDLRRHSMHNHLKLRHELVFAMRQYFNDRGFYEIETPTLTKCTPGGAKNFLVPCSGQPGTFYALSESPQIYKQLLMVGGIEKYFQIARCFRDEALRANRQPEFTQLDIEMAFVDETDIQTICEGLYKKLFKQFLNFDLPTPLPRYTYDDVFARFGSDKPDMRFDMNITDVSSLFGSLKLNFIDAILNKNGRVGCIVVKNHRFSRTDLDRLSDTCIKELGSKGLVWIRWKEDGSIDSTVTKFLPSNFLELAQASIHGLTQYDTIFAIADEYDDAWTTLGQLRLILGKQLNLIKASTPSLFWVTDFPMFEFSKETKKWVARHHPFTSPQDGWEKQELKDVKARAYDLVCNGEELGGGSIRIGSAEVQSKIFDILGISKEDAAAKFSFLMEAQEFGYPPEGGIAFGIDRLAMFFSGTESIRDVIAFPKTQRGSCLMMESPSKVEDDLLKTLHIKSTVIEKPKG